MVPKLSHLIENGKLLYTAPCDMENIKLENITKGYDDEHKAFRHALTTFFPEIPDKKDFKTMFTKSTAEGGSLLSCSASVLFERMKLFSKRLSTEDDEVSRFQQFTTLFHVMFLRILRARIPIITQLIHHVMVGTFFGEF